MFGKLCDNDKEKFSGKIRTFYLEATKSTNGMTLILGGIIGVSDFSDEQIVLLSHGGRITVSGKKLFINVYENNNVEIAGKVEAVSFKYGKVR